jgi:hypothetical protein
MEIYSWQKAWRNKAFRWNLISGLIILIIVIFFTYNFFAYIQNIKGGEVLNDWILGMLPAKDVSIPIVFFEASVIIIFFLRCTTNPTMFITFLIGLIFILISRCITIDITQFRAPTGIIDLKDPIAGMIYKTKSSNRDLFYSGHASILFLFYLCSTKKVDKYYMLLAVISLSILLLIQHVHYTVDVVSAPFFAFGCYWLSQRVLRLSPKMAMNKV